MQIKLGDTTIDRIEALTGKKFTRGGDKLVNEVLNIAEGREPNDNKPRVMMCSGMQEALKDE